MNLEIREVKVDEREILARLLELYEYEFSEYTDVDVNSLGLYGYSYLDYYWNEEKRFAYFIEVDGNLAGFVMICDYCYISSDDDTNFMSEFFVMNKYRRKGIGRSVVNKVFKQHPGKWELTVHPKNVKSKLFWESVIKEEVGQNYQKHLNVEGIFEGISAIAYTFCTN